MSEPSERAKALRKGVAGAANELTKAWERSEPSADAMTATLTASAALDDYIARLEAVADAARATVEQVDNLRFGFPSVEALRAALDATTDGGDATKKGEG